MLFERWMDKNWSLRPQIVFPNALDVRVLRAARQLAQLGLARPLLLGNQFRIRDFAEENKVRLSGVSIRKPIHHPSFDAYCRSFRKEFAPDKKIPEVRKLLQDEKLFALQLLLHGEAQSVFLLPEDFNALLTDWAAVLSDGQHMLSAFSLIWNEANQQMMAFADPYFYPRPSAEQLAEIAATTGRNFTKLTGQPAKVAMLSFSSGGSASHPLVQTVQQAVKLARKKAPELKIEGEIQFDAAFVPQIGQKKVPNNVLRGAANVYIFPSLGAANIGLKIVQTLTPYKTLGPIVQGLKYSLQMISDEICEDGLFKQIIVASNLLNV